jgi:glyoxylase-like metal-dependent hydrolase (beta-lactamase superfamily II)
MEEITELAPGIRRLQLPMDMPGLGHVNCYLLDDANGVALVDPGLPGPRPYRWLKAGLKRAGVRLKDVHTVVVTHSHPDHFGAAGRLRAEVGAEVVTHRNFRLWWDRTDEDRDFVESVEQADENAALLSEQVVVPSSRSGPDAPTPWGGERFKFPLRKKISYEAMRRGWGGRFFSTPRPSRRVDDGEVLRLAGRELVAVHTPGHTVDHLCLFDPDSGLMISGDHILPTITPHISGLGPTTDPLTSYFESLDRSAEMQGVTLVLPAHGLHFTDLAGRARAIRAHHEERLDILRDASDDLPHGTVPDYMRRLFKERAWGPMAESETFAHLEHLRRVGDVDVRRRDDDLLEYQFA